MLLKKILFISIILVTVFCMAGACVQNGDNGDSSQGNSLLSDAENDRLTDDETEREILLDKAIENFLLAVNPSEESAEEISQRFDTGGIKPEIYQIMGFGVNREGKSEKWILGIKYGTNKSMVSYENRFLRESVWPGSLPEEKIDTGSVLMPSVIISQNSELLNPLFEKDAGKKISIVLSEGVYRLRPENSDQAEEIKISAYTGEVIQQS